MAVPSPAELIDRFGRRPPEELAQLLEVRVRFDNDPPALPGVTVRSEYLPKGRIIVLYRSALQQQAAASGEPLPRLIQWHIAHELYHVLAEDAGRSPWRVRETEADLWADELLTLVPLPSAAP